MPNLAKLRDEHVELLRLVRKLGLVILEPMPPPHVDLFELRRELASLLVSHLKTEDWVLYPRLLASGDRMVVSTARRFIDELGGLADAYARHSHNWTAFTIAADWDGYCRDAGVLILALEQRIHFENRELYPLLEKVDRAA